MTVLENINIYYKSLRAIQDVSFCIRDSELVCVGGIGGAGKTSLLCGISGITDFSGSIRHNSSELRGLSVRQRLHLGVSMSPEGRHCFYDFTVEENLLCGGAILEKKEREKALARVYELFDSLYEKRRRRAGIMSGGEQQLLCVARAMMTSPSLLICDEVTMGLSPVRAGEMADILRRYADSGAGVLVSCQNPAVIQDRCDKIITLSDGKIISEQ